MTSTPTEMLQRSFDRAQAAVSKIGPDDFEKPSVCTDWNVRQLVDHMTGICAMFSAALEGKSDDMQNAAMEVGGADPKEAHREAARRSLELWRQDGALDRTLKMS